MLQQWLPGSPGSCWKRWLGKGPSRAKSPAPHHSGHLELGDVACAPPRAQCQGPTPRKLFPGLGLLTVWMLWAGAALVLSFF